MHASRLQSLRAFNIHNSYCQHMHEYTMSTIKIAILASWMAR